MTGFNLKRIRTIDTFIADIKDEEGNKTGVTFTLAGPNHQARKDFENAHTRKLLARANRGEGLHIDPEDAEQVRIEKLVRCTLGWQGYTDDAGQPVAFTQQAVRELYTDPGMSWLVAQVEKALTDDKLFTKRADPN